VAISERVSSRDMIFRDCWDAHALLKESVFFKNYIQLSGKDPNPLEAGLFLALKTRISDKGFQLKEFILSIQDFYAEEYGKAATDPRKNSDFKRSFDSAFEIVKGKMSKDTDNYVIFEATKTMIAQAVLIEILFARSDHVWLRFVAD
jgi:hypothetical protein